MASHRGSAPRRVQLNSSRESDRWRYAPGEPAAAREEGSALTLVVSHDIDNRRWPVCEPLDPARPFVNVTGENEDVIVEILGRHPGPAELGVQVRKDRKLHSIAPFRGRRPGQHPQSSSATPERPQARDDDPSARGFRQTTGGHTRSLRDPANPSCRFAQAQTRWLPAMRQQFANPAVALARQPFEHILQLREGLVTIEPRGLDQAHDRSGTLARPQAPREQPARCACQRAALLAGRNRQGQ